MVDTPGKITLWQMEIFVATAEEASISAAARRLGASNSAVSQQLSNLEAALGARLLERGERPMSLTAAGEMFQRRANSILHEAAQATAELTVRDMSSRVRLRLGMIEDFDADVTPALLMKLAETMPKARFLLETAPSHRLIDKLETRGLDLVVAAEPTDLPSSMMVHPLLVDPFVVVTPRRMIRDRAKMLDRLRQTPLIQYTAQEMMGRQIAGHLARQNVTPSHRFELDSYHSIMAMVARGEGWAILTPLGVMRAKRFMDRVETFPLPFAPLSRRISLIARRDSEDDLPRQLAAELRPLIAAEIIEFCHGRMPWIAEQMRVLNEGS